VTLSLRIFAPIHRESVKRVAADDLEHPKAGLVVGVSTVQQVAGDERAEVVEEAAVVARRLDRVERAAAGEDGERRVQ
jgi:hypothetical protein